MAIQSKDAQYEESYLPAGLDWGQAAEVHANSIEVNDHGDRVPFLAW